MIGGQEADALPACLKPLLVPGDEQSFEHDDLDAVVAVMKTTTDSSFGLGNQRYSSSV